MKKKEPLLYRYYQYTGVKFNEQGWVLCYEYREKDLFLAIMDGSLSCDKIFASEDVQ